MKRRTLTVLVMTIAMGLTTATAAFAGGNSDVATIHPGHQGYLSSDGKNIGAPPVFHFGAHGGPGYDAGPGGWGSAVSEAASSSGGLKKAHGG